MALIKSIEHKGVQYNYWIIALNQYEKVSGKTIVVLWGYPSKEVRDLDLNYYCLDFQPRYEFAGDLTTEQSYAKVKESVLVKHVLKEAEPAQTKVILDENGSVIGEEVVVDATLEEFEMVEINPLVNAIDLI